MNTQNSILLLDPAFDLSTSVNCNLLIRLGIDSFSYAILNKETNKIKVVFDEQECEDPSKKLNERIANDANLSLNFNEIKIAVYTKNSISIPNAFYQSQGLKLNTGFFTPPYSENVYTTEHPNFGFTSVFSFSKITDEMIGESFPNSIKYHPNTALLKLAENGATTSLLLDFTAGAMYVLFLREKQVVFQQGYEIENAEEFNYYLLLMINQLAVNPNATSVYISGIIHQDDEKYSCLNKYFNSIQFLNFEDLNLDQQILEDIPSHYYTTLLALDQCV